MFIQERIESLTDTRCTFAGVFVAVEGVEAYKSKLKVMHVEGEWHVCDFVVMTGKEDTYQSVCSMFSPDFLSSLLNEVTLPALNE